MFICPRGFLLHSQALSVLMLLQMLWSAAAQFFAAPLTLNDVSTRELILSVWVCTLGKLTTLCYHIQLTPNNSNLQEK